MVLVKYNNNSISTISSAGQLASGSLVPIKTLTASSSSTLSFVDGSSDVVLDNTYPIYLFKFINIHPATDSTEFGVGFRDGSTDYDATKTTTAFVAVHNEGDSEAALNNRSSNEGLSQNTGFQSLNLNMGNGNDESLSGEMFLFNPSSTTFVKNFISSSMSNAHNGSYAWNTFMAGYGNTTSAVNGIRFKMSSGNIDSGVIKLYGIS